MATISGGDALKKRLEELSHSVTTAAEVQVGWPEGGETYPDGKPVAMIAALNEFGHGKTPPRPAFRTMVAKESPGWGDLVARGLQANGNDAAKALAAAGLVIEGQLAESIVNGAWAPNAMVTNLLKQRFPMGGQTFADFLQAVHDVANGATAPAGKPLVHTGQELGAIKSVVK